MIDGFISRRLSGKLLLMTFAFVMLAEVVIFIPSAALYRQMWLEGRAERAGHIVLALTGVPDFQASEVLTRQFMDDTDIIMLSAKRAGMKELILGEPPFDADFELVDIRGQRRFPHFGATFRSYFGDMDGFLRIRSGAVLEGQEYIEYIVPRASLKGALQDFAGRIFWLSIIIALVSGLLLYLTLSVLIVKPIKNLARALADFRENPELKRSNLPPSSRKDEIGQLQREFYDMRQSVRASLKQRERLATLGLAVAKINHDLRNVLTSAQLISDRLAMDREERVANMGQRLVRAIDRGIKLCADVLNFSQSKEGPPQLQSLKICFLLGEAAGDVLPTFGTGPRKINFVNTVPSGLVVFADPDHSYRIFNNLFRNAAQAMAAIKDDIAERKLIVAAQQTDSHVEISVTDTGPGLPHKVQDNLFQAFVSSSGHGSTGLGLTIARELAHAQGGKLVLTKTGSDGTSFKVYLRKHPTKKAAQS